MNNQTNKIYILRDYIKCGTSRNTFVLFCKSLGMNLRFTMQTINGNNKKCLYITETQLNKLKELKKVGRFKNRDMEEIFELFLYNIENK